MKKAVSLILALMLPLSLCACGAECGSGTSQMSKKDMLSSAESVDMKDFTDVVDNNIVSAKQLYCGKVLEVTGVVGEIKEDHIALVYESTYSGKIIDVYLSTEELAFLQLFQKIVVVGLTEDTVKTVSTTVRGYDTEELHFPMKQAYLVEDTFEVDGTLRTQDASYLPEIVFNFQIGGESKLQNVYFSEEVDTSQIEWGTDMTIRGKFIYLPGIDFWDITEATIVE